MEPWNAQNEGSEGQWSQISITLTTSKIQKSRGIDLDPAPNISITKQK